MNGHAFIAVGRGSDQDKLKLRIVLLSTAILEQHICDKGLLHSKISIGCFDQLLVA